MRSTLKAILKSFKNHLFNPKLYWFVFLWILHGNTRRFTKRNIHFRKHRFCIPDGPSFVWQFKDIFIDEIYNFESVTDTPLIYDCGANIGMSVIYFRQLYPKSIIKAFEPDPYICSILRDNLRMQQVPDVEIIEKAVWINNDEIWFGLEGADGSSCVSLGEKRAKVSGIRLKDLLLKEPRIDLLKLDIEGAENTVLDDCRDCLGRVQNLFIEYHGFHNKQSDFIAILEILRQNNFKYDIYNTKKINKPFLNKKRGSPYDQQFNIFAFQENK